MDFDSLGEVSRGLFEALLDLGASEFHGKYDGGGDEGYAQADYSRFGSNRRSCDNVVDELVRTRVPSMGSDTQSFRKTGDWQDVKGALDLLAYELAVQLMGGSFGVEVSSIHRAFTVELFTGHIIDALRAPMPDEPR